MVKFTVIMASNTQCPGCPLCPPILKSYMIFPFFIIGTKWVVCLDRVDRIYSFIRQLSNIMRKKKRSCTMNNSHIMSHISYPFTFGAAGSGDFSSGSLTPLLAGPAAEGNHKNEVK